ncbi:hypothetical protein [Tichowtungia aerotolerans]|uniref:Alpha-L-arabinofuranosidase 1 catalytic domain-containing protein n=1 Tax=Tichowtungia aerotolerans TaxID=2697043 RepID=A0A6P1MB43_9BACT|nr:hypothetical protein [Tichowtungia aerotolerans]QHI70323.1 hypothetical protein GT409_13020 [Tichowtungia aerotolerans]
MAFLGYSDAVSNRIADAGFEVLAGNEPNVATAPWFTSGEGGDESFITDTNRAHSGSQSGLFKFYYDNGAFVQNLNIQVDPSREYEASIWMLTGEPSSNSTHTNAPTLNATIYTAASPAGPYTYRKGFFWGGQNREQGVWEKFSGVVIGSEMAEWAGEYIQIRFAKPNVSVSHRIWIDDAFFGEIPEADAAVSVDVSAGEHVVTKMAMGTGLVYSWYADSMFSDGEVAHIIKDIGLGALRWPGGAVVTFYHWNDLNGQGWMDHWNPAYDTANDQPPENFMDLDEYLALIDETGAEIMLGVNMSSGIEWGREAEAIAEASNLMVYCQSRGYDVKYIYFDNENFQSGNNYNYDSDGDGEAWNAALYAQQFNLYAAAVKATFPDAKLIANARNNVTGPAFLSDMQTMLSIAGTNIDFVDLHYYWEWNTASWDSWKSQLPMTRAGAQTYQESIEYANALFASEGYPNIRAAVLEWNIGPGPWMTDPGHNNFKTALMQSEMQMQFLSAGLDIGLLYTLESTNVDPLNDKHVIHNSDPNATALWMWLFSKTVGKTVVQSSSPTAGIYMVALKGDDGELAVYLLNKTDQELNVEFDLGGYVVNEVSEAWRFHDGGTGRGELQRIGLWEMGGNHRTTLKSDSMNMVLFNGPAAVAPARPTLDARIVQPVSDGLLVGWYTTAGKPDTSVSGVSGSLMTSRLYDVDDSAGSDDGTFGTVLSGASTDLTAYAVQATNGSDTVVFSIENQSGLPLRLDAVCFDYSRWWQSSPKDIALVYESGDFSGVSNGTVIQSAVDLPNIGKTGDWSDFEWGLTNLNDRVLDHGEEVLFSLNVFNADAIWANGAFDNIAITGGTASNAVDSLLVAWRAETAKEYTVMHASSLLSNSWEEVSEPVSGIPADMSVSVPVEASGFYRLQVSPSN